MTSSSRDPAFTLKGGAFTATVLELLKTDPDLLHRHLMERLADPEAARFLRQSPVVMSLDRVTDADVDWAAVLQAVQSAGLLLAGWRAPAALHETLSGLGLPFVSAGRAAAAPAAASVPAPAPTSRTQVVTQPVRGGTQIYAPGDLIVLAPVSAGAEVLADGHIHLYAPLRGRALAGVQGNTEARIFCQSLEAELVSIAGRYRTADQWRGEPSWSSAVQLRLEADTLVASPLS